MSSKTTNENKQTNSTSPHTIWEDSWVSETHGNIANETALSTVTSIMLVCEKGKAVPLQAWTGPQGSRRLRLPDF
jgi:hypothetical protein